MWTVERSNPSSAYARDFAHAACGEGLTPLANVKNASYFRSGSRSHSDSGTPTLSESNEDNEVERVREVRQKRVREIRDSKRKRKPESDIEDGEVDSEGETFEPIQPKPKKVGKVSDKKFEKELEPASVKPKSTEQSPIKLVDKSLEKSPVGGIDEAPPEKSEALSSVVSKPETETDEEDFTFDLPNRDDFLELEVGPTEVNS